MLLKEHEEDQLANYIQVLKPFYEATMEMCSETLGIGSKVIPIIALIMKSLEDVPRWMRVSGCRSQSHRQTVWC